VAGGWWLAGGWLVADLYNKSGMVPGVFDGQPTELMLGMCSTLAGTLFCLAVSTSLGLPISTAHAIGTTTTTTALHAGYGAGVGLVSVSQRGWLLHVACVASVVRAVGGIVGFTVMGKGMAGVDWRRVGRIMLSTVTSPLLGMPIAHMSSSSPRPPPRHCCATSIRFAAGRGPRFPSPVVVVVAGGRGPVEAGGGTKQRGPPGTDWLDVSWGRGAGADVQRQRCRWCCSW
jgi:phosphate/sulfate permease